MASHQDVAVIILAAGEGTRMRSNLPKVMHKLAHFPMIQYVTETAVQLKPKHVVTVIGPKMESVQKAVSDILPSSVEASFVVQQDRLGTGDAVKQALPSLGEFKGNIIVLYGDTPLLTERTLSAMLEQIDSGKANGIVVLGFCPDDPAAYGRLVTDDEGVLEAIVEFKDASEAEKEIDLCNSGVMAFPAQVAKTLIPRITNNNAKKEYYLTDLVALATNAGLCSVYTEVENVEEVMGVNSRAELAEAEYALQSMLRDMALARGATLTDPDSVYFAADTQLGKDVLVEPNVFFGPGVTVGDGVHIKAFSHIEGAVIANDAVVGPFARLRPGAKLKERVHVGNFVEVKNSTLEAESKANHLSYLGDSHIGERTNIGAGTITCNYDGFGKHQTTIGKECLVGSNTILVAPVSLGDGVVTGAGSVLTQNVESDALAIARITQQNHAGKGRVIKQRKAQRQAQLLRDRVEG
jgi:bifunctional UDP-N-acetylglucosamine pyrophosphorylase/glucosamine-1-phosphate N-acetyltransferase